MKSKVLSILEVLVLILIPVTLGLCAYFQFDQTALLTMAVAIAGVLVFFLGYESSRPSLRQIMPTVVLSALAAAGRVIFMPIPNFQPVTAICVVSGAVFGRRSGFMVGALAALVSNFFLGQGPWTPWQMYAWGMIGYFAGVLADHGWFKYKAAIYVYGIFASVSFGLLLNTWFLIGFVHPITLEAALLAYGAGLVTDAFHAASTVVFLLAIYLPWRKKLERIKKKYDLGIPDQPHEVASQNTETRILSFSEIS